MKIITRAMQYTTVLALTLGGSISGIVSSMSGDRTAPRSFMLALPRIEISVDRDGVPAIGNLSPVSLNRATRGLVPADALRVPTGWVDYFTSTNTQHVELIQKDDGLYIWVNGKRLPNIAYDASTLKNLSALSERTNALQAIGMSRNSASFVSRAMPLLRRIGLNMLVRFPRQNDADDIEARSVKATMVPAASAQNVPVQGVINAVLVYDDKGDVTLHGMSSPEFISIFGVEPGLLLALKPEFVQAVMQRNVQHVTLRSESNGLQVRVNGKQMPKMQCDLECLTNLGDTFALLNTYPELEYMNGPIKSFAPYLNTVDAQIVLRFPASAGVEPIEPASAR